MLEADLGAPTRAFEAAEALILVHLQGIRNGFGQYFHLITQNTHGLILYPSVGLGVAIPHLLVLRTFYHITAPFRWD